MTKQMIDFGNDWCRDDQLTFFFPQQLDGPLMPGVCAVVIRVENPGVENESHYSAPKPDILRTLSARLDVVLVPLSNAPPPGGAAEVRDEK